MSLPDCLKRGCIPPELLEKMAVENWFSLYSSVDGWEEPTREIVKSIEDFAEAYEKIAEKYPKYGIGDTQTDEDVVSYLYRRIHFPNLPGIPWRDEE